jgi:hypothetical protein
MLPNSCINRINHKCAKTRLLVTHWWHHIISKQSTEVVQLHFKASDRLAETQQVAVSRRHESSHICWFIRAPRVMFIAVVTSSSLHGYLANPKLAAQWWFFESPVVFDPRKPKYPMLTWDILGVGLVTPCYPVVLQETRQIQFLQSHPHRSLSWSPQPGTQHPDIVTWRSVCDATGVCLGYTSGKH